MPTVFERGTDAQQASLPLLREERRRLSGPRSSLREPRQGVTLMLETAEKVLRFHPA